MMVSDEEKRWLVVGIAMNKVAAPVLRDYIKQGMDTHYTNNTYCHGLTAPCTLKTLTYHHVNADPNLRRLKFQNINNNLQNHGNHKNLYNYNINSSVDLANLFLPEYLAEFSAFDESLDISAILRLLGFNNPAPIFPSSNPLISIQLSADDVRENVRNKWGHCNVTDWTEVLFNDCFSKIETLVRSLGLTGGIEKTTLDQLSDWKTKGCQLCMGHAVDQNLLSLVQQNVKELIKNFKKTEAEQTAIQETLAQLKTEQREMQCVMRVQLEEHDEQLEAVLAWKEQQLNENKEILVKLVSLEKTLTEEFLGRLQGVEDDISGVKAHISQTDTRVKQLKESVRDDVSEVKVKIFQTDKRVKQLEENVKDLTMKDDRPEASLLGSFDVKTCQTKLAEHYQKTAKVPTTVWSSVFQVDLEQIYTRLSWVKNEHTPAGSSKKELSHYTELFTQKTKSGAVPKRILVQGETGIGKTTFVKKLLVDWSNLEEAKMDEAEEGEDTVKKFNDEVTLREDEDLAEDDGELSTDAVYMGKGSKEWAYLEEVPMHEEQKDTLRKFELVVSINLKEVSKCHTLTEVISLSRLFPDDEEKIVDDLLCYIRNNQEKVLVVFDGYDEYRTGSDAEEKYGSRSNSPVYEIFYGNILRDCTVLVTTRSSRADEIRGLADIQAEITGFNVSDRQDFMRKMLESQTQVDGLLTFLWESNMEDLARVPLLALFFCLLWKEEKEKLMELTESKTKLFRAITKHILQHSHRKHSKTPKLKEADYEEILSETGKVALAGLLKGDLMFEYDQLPQKVRGEESIIVGLFQMSEYGPSLEPMEMVSFIHKSIQEYLAAWYITYRCVPEGNLGGIEQHARTLEDCEALENVYQFICGLSDDGAVKVFQHLASVRISDPTLDLSKTIPDVEHQSDVPLCDVSYRHQRFSDLIYNFFHEGNSKAGLLSQYFECSGGIVLVTRDRPLLEHMPEVNDLSLAVPFGVFVFAEEKGFPQHHQRGILRYHYRDVLSMLYEWLKFLNCLHAPLTTFESSEVLIVGDFLSKFRNIQSACLRCCFSSIVFFRNGKFQFYITDLKLCCGEHARLFSQTVSSSLSTKFSSVPSCLKFLRSLFIFYRLNSQEIKDLSALIKNSKHLKSIRLNESSDYLCDLLEQVSNPKTCTLKIGLGPVSVLSMDKQFMTVHRRVLTSAGAAKLADLFSRFNSVVILHIVLTGCCFEAMTTLVTSITHQSLEELSLSVIDLAPTAIVALGRSLPEMSSLYVLSLTSVNGSFLPLEAMNALFGSFRQTLPLETLFLRGFYVRGCLAPLVKSLQFFSNLRTLVLEALHMDEDDLRCLLESIRLVPNLEVLSLGCNPLGHAVMSIASYVIHLPNLQLLFIHQTDCTKKDYDKLKATVKEIRRDIKVTDWPYGDPPKRREKDRNL